MAEGPRDLTVGLDGMPFHYRDWGGAGQPIVLLHGLASTCHIWDLVAPILRRAFRVVALDQRGHGESGKPHRDMTLQRLPAIWTVSSPTWNSISRSSLAIPGAATLR